MMRRRIIAFITAISYNSYATESAICGSGGSVSCTLSTGVTQSLDAVSSYLNRTWIDVAPSTPDDATISGATNDSVLLNRFIRMTNKGLSKDLTLNLSPSYDSSQVGAPSLAIAPGANVVFADTLGTLSVNVSGYNGSAGKNASRVCADAILAGSYGATVKTNFLNRRSADPMLSATACDATDLSSISTQAGKSIADNFCPTGSSYLSSYDGSGDPHVAFDLKLKKRKCEKQIKTQKTCEYGDMYQVACLVAGSTPSSTETVYHYSTGPNSWWSETSGVFVGGGSSGVLREKTQDSSRTYLSSSLSDGSSAKYSLSASRSDQNGNVMFYYPFLAPGIMVSKASLSSIDSAAVKQQCQTQMTSINPYTASGVTINSNAIWGYNPFNFSSGAIMPEDDMGGGNDSEANQMYSVRFLTPAITIPPYLTKFSSAFHPRTVGLLTASDQVVVTGTDAQTKSCEDVSPTKFKINQSTASSIVASNPSLQGIVMTAETIEKNVTYSSDIKYVNYSDSCLTYVDPVYGGGYTESEQSTDYTMDASCLVGGVNVCLELNRDCSYSSCSGASKSVAKTTAYYSSLTVGSGERGTVGGSVVAFAYNVTSLSQSYAHGSDGVNGTTDITNPTTTKYCAETVAIDESKTLDLSYLTGTTVNSAIAYPFIQFTEVKLTPVYFYPPALTTTNVYPLRSPIDAVKVFKKVDPSVRDKILRITKGLP